MKQFIRRNDWMDSSMDVGWGNGYIAIPKSSSWHGMKYDDIPVDVHGGLTYADLASNASFKPDDIDDSDWIIGFDTCHYNDNEYSCDKEYVTNETNELFKQMVKLDALGFAKMQKTVSCPHCSSVYVLPEVDSIYVETSERECDNCHKKYMYQCNE